MFILDSLFMSGFRWVLDTIVTAAESEMNDDTALREQLLAAEMRRELGEISDEEFAGIEASLLARIREIKTRREGGTGPIAFGEAIQASGDAQLQVEAMVTGDFHAPASASTTPIPEPVVVSAKTDAARPKRKNRSARRPRTPARSAEELRHKRSNP